MAAEEAPMWPESCSAESRLYIRRKVHPIMSPLIESVTFTRPDDPEDFMVEYFLGGVVSPKVLAERMSAAHLLSPDSKLIIAHESKEEADGAWTEAEVAKHYAPFLVGAYPTDSAEAMIGEIIQHLVKEEPDRVAQEALTFLRGTISKRKDLGAMPVRSGTPTLGEAPGTPKSSDA